MKFLMLGIAYSVLLRRGSSEIALDTALLTAEEKWPLWKARFGVHYESSEVEKKAENAFFEVDARIIAHNAKTSSYTLGHNRFSDLSAEEFKFRYLSGYQKPMSKHHFRSGDSQVEDMPESIDWVAMGKVTPVKDQGSCGACYAFSSTGAIEAAYAISSGTLISLSEQMIMSCSADHGCQGGSMDHSFAWIQENGGICAGADYPYDGVNEACHSTNCTKQVTLSGFLDLPPHDEEALMASVARQPVSVAIEADPSIFQSYSSGILDSSACGTSVNHGVLVVGYGTDTVSGLSYYKLKNSWGIEWGEDGYFYMGHNANVCGIATAPSFPIGVTKASTTQSESTTTHYSDPFDEGCLPDEIIITINGISGEACAPTCSIVAACPTDLPDGVTAIPSCALEDASSGATYCALICSASDTLFNRKASDTQCGDLASCKALSAGLGICTYDS